MLVSGPRGALEFPSVKAYGFAEYFETIWLGRMPRPKAILVLTGISAS